MSERDERYTLAWVLIIAVVLGVLAATTVRSRSELRDLQRRVGQLESMSTTEALPQHGEIRWCTDCSAGLPCGEGSGAWRGRLADGRYFCVNVSADLNGRVIQ